MLACKSEVEIENNGDMIKKEKPLPTDQVVCGILFLRLQLLVHDIFNIVVAENPFHLFL